MAPQLHFTVNFVDPGYHVYHVTLHISQLPKGRHTLSLPVWTPGAYEIQDFARHVFHLKLKSNDVELALHHQSKNSWEFETFTDLSEVTVTYQVYAFELGVDTSHLDESHAYWNGAQLFFWLDEFRSLPITVKIEHPAGWKVATGLDPDPDHPGQYIAANYDVLIDSPVECGTHRSVGFIVDDKPHTVALWGHGNEDADAFARDIQRIVEAQRDIFHELPYRHYTFIMHLSDRGTGGLEHLNSTTCGMERFSFKPRKKYRRVLGLVSHEFFHLWNVKRIHPDMLGPFDYSREVYTHLLWAMEGFTDYYAALSLRRADLFSVKEYLEDMADNLKAYEKQPGRLVQSLAESSFDTWIKLYKPDEDSRNRTISYYLKGDLVGTCLDLEIRHRTNNDHSLDDVLRILYQRYAAYGIGFPEHVYQETVEEVAQSSFQEFFDRYINGTEEIPLALSLDYAGLEIRRSYKNPESDDVEPSAKTVPAKPWLGIDAKSTGDTIRIATSYTNGPAAASLYANDQVIAVDSYQVKNAKDLTKRIEINYRPGDTVNVSVFRRGHLVTVPVVLAEAPYDKIEIKPVAEPTQAQKDCFESWLKAPFPPSPKESV